MNRGILKRLRRLEDRPVNPARFRAALAHYRETGELPRDPNLADHVKEWAEFIAAAWATIPPPPQEGCDPNR